MRQICFVTLLQCVCSTINVTHSVFNGIRMFSRVTDRDRDLLCKENLVRFVTSKKRFAQVPY